MLRRFVARTLEASSELVFGLSMILGDLADMIGARSEIDEQLDEVVAEWAADG